MNNTASVNQLYDFYFEKSKLILWPLDRNFTKGFTWVEHSQNLYLPAYKKAGSVITTSTCYAFRKASFPGVTHPWDFFHGCFSGAFNSKLNVFCFLSKQMAGMLERQNKLNHPTAAVSSVCLTIWICLLMGRERGPQLHLACGSQILKLKILKSFFVISSPLASD